MDVAPDVPPPPVPEQIRCTPDGPSCNPVQCDGACEVDCKRRDLVCVLDCATDELCALECSGATGSCEMTGCDDPVQCGFGWVCNGECGI
jgi:hypothetical protein